MRDLDNAIMLACIVADPVCCFRRQEKHTRTALKLMGGVAMGLLISWISRQIVEGGPQSVRYLLIIPFGVMTLMIGGFAVKRFLADPEQTLGKRLNAAAIEFFDTSGPLVMMAVLGTCMAFYWLAGIPWTILFAFIGSILIGIASYAAFFYDGTDPPLFDDDIKQPRSNTLGEALSKVLDVSVKLLPGALFMSGMIWLSFAFWSFEGAVSPAESKDPMAIIVPLMWAAGISCAVLIGGILLAQFVFATLAMLAAQIRPMDLGEMEMRAKKFGELLYGGSIGKLFHASLDDTKR